MSHLTIGGFLTGAMLLGASGVPAQTPPAVQSPAAQPPAGHLPPEQPPAPEPRERRPYRGLFGGSEARAGQPGLSLLLTGAGGYDENLLAGQPGSTGPRAPVAGSFALGGAELWYGAVRGRGTFDATASSQLQYYDSERNWHRVSHSGRVAVALPLGRRSIFTASQGVRYSPYYQLDVAPALPGRQSPELQDAALVDVRGSVTALDNYTYMTDLGAEQPLGSGSIRYGYAFRATGFTDASLESRAQRAAVSYSRRASRYATLRLGYGYERVSRGESGTRASTLHAIDLGGGYSRPLSFSRRTTVSFSGGTALADTRFNRRYRFIGDAAVHQEIGRTWLWRGAYRQGVQVVDVFPDPLFGYTVRTALDGLVGRRNELSFDARYSSGRFDSGRASDGYASAQGSARLRRAITRSLAAHVEYSYHRYDFAGATPPAGVAQDLRRHGVTLGVSLWLPIFVPRDVDAAR